MYCRNADNTPGPGTAVVRKNDLASRRSAAKIGMALSLGTLVYTGFRGRESATLHIGAGIALLGFSFWHYRLYQPPGHGLRK